MNILKQSTAVDVLIGPFVDSTDGDSEETTLTISASDVRLSKNGQTAGAKNDATACAHDADGFYNCELDATDTNTVGTLVIYVHEAGALAVRHEFQVIEEAVYDAFFGASATGLLPANVTQIGGAAVNTSTAQLGVNVVNAAGTAWGSGAITAASIASNAITAAKIATDAITAAKIAANAIGASELASDAVIEIQSGLGTAAELAKVPKSDGTASWNATALAAINAEADTALSDYDPPTKTELDSGFAGLNDPTAAAIRSEIDSNSTQLALILTKLLAYVQLLARSDAAIETDNSTELTAINADGGSGAGNFSAQTDSVEAIRDHVGDGTNLTEAGGDGDHLTEAGGDGDHLTEAGGDGDHLAEAGGTGDQLTALGTAAELAKVPKSDGTASWNATALAAIEGEVDDALESTVADSIPSDGTRPSVKQALYMLTQFMLERSVSTTTVTVNKVDGSTALFTLTLDDDTTPTSITRAT